MLVRGDYSAKIGDAGLQAITRYCQQSRSKRLAASFEWAAPELLLGQRSGFATIKCPNPLQPGAIVGAQPMQR